MVEHNLEIVLKLLVVFADMRSSLHQQALSVPLAGVFLDRLCLVSF